MSDDIHNKNRVHVHEAKSHITVISGYLQLLKNFVNSENFNVDKANELIDKTTTSCSELEKTIESID